MHIDEPRRDDGTGSVDDFLATGGLEMLPYLRDDAVADSQIAQGVQRAGGIDDSGTLYERSGQTVLAFTRKSKTAMRTATPCET